MPSFAAVSVLPISALRGAAVRRRVPECPYRPDRLDDGLQLPPAGPLTADDLPLPRADEAPSYLAAQDAGPCPADPRLDDGLQPPPSSIDEGAAYRGGRQDEGPSCPERLDETASLPARPDEASSPAVRPDEQSSPSAYRTEESSSPPGRIDECR